VSQRRLSFSSNALCFVLSALAALAVQKEIVNETEHRAGVGVHRDDRVKRQAEAFLVHPQGRGVLNGEHMSARDLGAGARPGRSHHLGDRHPGIMQKSGNPHLASAVAPKPPHADALAAMRDEPLIQIGPPHMGRLQSSSFISSCACSWVLDPKHEPVSCHAALTTASPHIRSSS